MEYNKKGIAELARFAAKEGLEISFSKGKRGNFEGCIMYLKRVCPEAEWFYAIEECLTDEVVCTVIESFIWHAKLARANEAKKLMNKAVDAEDRKPMEEMETAILKMNDRIAELEQELAKERSECKKWYHEYHVVKDMLESEAEYLRNAQKLSDEYFCELTKAQIELDVLREAIENISMKATEAKEYRLGNRKGAICRPEREGKHENTQGY